MIDDDKARERERLNRETAARLLDIVDRMLLPDPRPDAIDLDTANYIARRVRDIVKDLVKDLPEPSAQIVELNPRRRK
jgi:hypothetical protein